MIKREELTNPQSCMSRAKDDEMTFVLLARDVAAPAAIAAWAQARVTAGKNKYGDAQIQEAFECAAKMQQQHSARTMTQHTPPPRCRVCQKPITHAAATLQIWTHVTIANFDHDHDPDLERRVSGERRKLDVGCTLERDGYHHLKTHDATRCPNERIPGDRRQDLRREL